LARHLSDVRRERAGEVVSRKTGGDPHTHITEIRQARRALRARVARLINSLSAQHDPDVEVYVRDQIRRAEEIIRQMDQALGD
jgi:hypothetical protein